MTGLSCEFFQYICWTEAGLEPVINFPMGGRCHQTLLVTARHT